MHGRCEGDSKVEGVDSGFKNKVVDVWEPKEYRSISFEERGLDATKLMIWMLKTIKIREVLEIDG